MENIVLPDLDNAVIEKMSNEKSKRVMKKPIILRDAEDVMYVVDKDTFGDNEEHEIEFKLTDGIGISDDGKYLIFYPRKSEITKEMKHKMIVNDGIPAPRSYTYWDIALCFGEVRPNVTNLLKK